MLDLSPEKIVVVLVIALVVLGPGGLAEAARVMGRGLGRLRQLNSGLPPDTAKLIRNPRGAILDAVAEPGRAIAESASAASQLMPPTTEQKYGDRRQ